MTDKVKKQVEWVVNKLLSQANESIVLCVIYNKTKNEAKIYLDGEKVATISEEVSKFGWPFDNLAEEEIRKYMQIMASGTKGGRFNGDVFFKLKELKRS